MSEKSVAVIGAGIAGLAAGCYGRMNGYDTHIFEMHTGPGGLCTSWKRGGYTFDGCIQWLVGSREGPYYDMWREIGALPAPRIIDFDPFFSYETIDGRRVTFTNDADRLEEHLLEIAPEDTPLIKEFAGAVSHTASNDPAIYKDLFQKWGSISLRDFGVRLRSPLLTEAFSHILRREVSVFHFLATLAFMGNRNAGYPEGGSLAFSKRIEQRYRDLGGESSYGARVAKILTEANRAVGVRLADGTEIRADYVISAADGRTTIFDMLEGRYVNDETRRHYSGELPLFEPLVYVSLGVGDPLAEAPPYLTFNFASPFRVAGRDVRRATLRVYNFDPMLAPGGKVAVTVMFESDYGYWKDLSDKSPAAYREEKNLLAAAVLDELEYRFPSVKNKVEERDVATPATFERYTANWRGSFAGWQIPPRVGPVRISKTLPGLANFGLAGHWVTPGGGLPGAAASGREAVRLICEGEGRAFEPAG